MADLKKNVLDEDLIAIVHLGSMDDLHDVHVLNHLEVTCGGRSSTATVRMSSDGSFEREATGEGDGPIAAAFEAMESLNDFTVELRDLEIRAATPGRDALGEVSIQATVDGRTFTGRGASTDVVKAAARAYVHVLNKAERALALERHELEQANDLWGV